MNAVQIIGRTTKDVEVRYNGDMAIGKFTVAIDDGYGEKKRTNFIPVTVFGKTAESCEKFLAKGRLVAVQGKIQTGSYTNKNGDKVYTTDVIGDKVQFLEWGDKDGSQGQNRGHSDIPKGFEAIDEKDLPF